MVKIKLPDGSVKECPEGVRPREVAEGIGKRLAEAPVAAVADGRVVDLDRPLEDGEGKAIELRILTPRDREALDVLRHSTAHIMARAILRLFPRARLPFGSATTPPPPPPSWPGPASASSPAPGSRSARPPAMASTTTSPCPAQRPSPR